MSRDLSNREEQTYEYIKEMLRVNFPELDLRDDSAFMETFGLSHVKLFEPLLTYIDRVRLKQSLENAANMTEEEMDEVARGHYISRNLGEPAEGSVTLVFNDIPESGALVIPSGIEVAKSDVMTYRLNQTYIFSESDMVEYYEPSTFTYRMTLPFQANEPGSEGNANPREINELTKGDLPFLIEIVNESEFTGGTDKESNVDLANRIRNESFAPNLGIKRGYHRYLGSFSDVEDTLVAGYNHPLMKRDVIGQVDIPGIVFNENIRDLHWGTKVDVYVRGKTPTEVVEFLELTKDDEDRLTAPLNNLPVLEVLDVQLFSPDGSLDDPEIDPATLYVSDYTLEKEEDFETEGTLEEVATLIVWDDRLTSGDFVKVRYRYNALISTIHNAMYEEDNRPPTADVKIKEMNENFLYGAIIVQSNSAMGLRDNERNQIRQRLSRYINTLQRGSELQVSDLLTPLVEGGNTSESGIVDYVKLPYQTVRFERNNRHVYYNLEFWKREVLHELQEERPLVAWMLERFKDEITTYDFFDLLHSLTVENSFSEVEDEISYTDNDWKYRIDVFGHMRDILNRSRIERRLSPSVIRLEENEFFGIGEFFVYEDRTYTKSDWMQMITLFENLAATNETKTRDMYYLMVYIVMIAYAATTDQFSKEDIYEYVKALVERTPIEFEYYE